jgi:hypothetical protein
MSIPKVFFAMVLIVIFFNSCFHKNITNNHIEGVWESTEETSSIFEGIDKVALRIRKDSSNILISSGFFL